jgi:uncharacterized membrane protein
MSTTQCPECGFISPIASELCAQCGIELPRPTYSPANEDFRNPQFTTELPPPPFAPAQSIAFPLTLSKPIEPDVNIGNAIETTLSLFVKNGWFITKLVFVIFAPFEIFRALSIGDKNQSWQVAVGAAFLGLVCKALIAPSLIFSIFTVMRTGTTPTLTEAYRWGLSRVSKLVVCAVMAWILEALGFMLLIIPGIILGLAFELVYPMATLENRSPTDILKRSYALTKGHRWNILAVTFVIGLIAGIVNIPANIVTGVLAVQGLQFWPLQAAVAVVVDIVSEMTTVASLVIYLSILASRPPEQTLET